MAKHRRKIKSSEVMYIYIAIDMDWPTCIPCANSYNSQYSFVRSVHLLSKRIVTDLTCSSAGTLMLNHVEIYNI